MTRTLLRHVVALCLLGAAMQAASADQAGGGPRLQRPIGRGNLRGFFDPINPYSLPSDGGGSSEGNSSGGGDKESERRGLIATEELTLLSSNTPGTTNFFNSSFYMTPASVAQAVGSDVFASAPCSLDSTCVSGYETNQQAVVQITHPVTGNFCTGTLIKGRDGTIYVLTARHCVTGSDSSWVYPWSTYGVLFNYRLTCNASSVDSAEIELFGQYLQGLQVVFTDPESDVALLKLLDDIPPEYNAFTAGWDAAGSSFSFDWVDISKPSGDVEKFAEGKIVDAVKGQIIYADGSVETDTSPCSGLDCAFLVGYPTRGALAPGSSGSGLIHKTMKKVVGVLSAGGGDICSTDPSDPNVAVHQFGRLSTAWTNGLWQYLSVSPERISTNTEPYSIPVPGLIVDNDAPTIYETGPQTTIKVRLTSAPSNANGGTTTVSLSSDSELVALNASSLVFNSRNWNQSQTVSVSQGSGSLGSETSAASYNVTLSWPAFDSAGNQVDRRRVLTGIMRSAQAGSSFINPYKITSLPFSGTVDNTALDPRDPYITGQEGPFVPGFFMQVNTPNSAQGVVTWLCPGFSIQGDGPIAAFFDSDWRPQLELPPAGPFRDSSRPGCSGFLALLGPSQTYYIVTSPSYGNNGPNPRGLVRSYTVTVESISLEQTLVNMVNFGLPYVTQVPVSLVGNVSSFGGSTVPFLIEPPRTASYDFSTCNARTEADETTMALYNTDTTLSLIANDTSDNLACSELRNVQLRANQQYLLVVGEQSQAVLTRGASSTVELSIRFSGQGSGGGFGGPSGSGTAVTGAGLGPITAGRKLQAGGGGTVWKAWQP